MESNPGTQAGQRGTREPVRHRRSSSEQRRAVPPRNEAGRREPRPIASLLKGSELWSTYERLSALERDLNRLQPALALKPLKLTNQVLVVTAGSSAMAARMRQFEPSLVEGLRARGWLVGRIRFRPIAVLDLGKTQPPRPKDPVSTSVLDELERLGAAEMNPQLQAALAVFIRRHRGYRRT